MKKIFKIMVIVLIIIIVLIQVHVKIITKNSFTTKNLYSLQKSEFGIVPGASVLKNKPSLILKDRLDSSIELYNKKIIKKIFISGMKDSIYYNETQVMKNYLMSKEIPQKDIVLDFEGKRTFNTLLNAKIKFNIKNAIFISQNFHMQRAIFISQYINLQTQGFEANRSNYEDELFYKIREFFAILLAWYDVVKYRY